MSIAALALTGPGRYAVDAFAGWDVTGRWALGSIAAGLVVGALALATRRTAPVGEDRSSTAHAGSGRPRTPAAA